MNRVLPWLISLGVAMTGSWDGPRTAKSADQTIAMVSATQKNCNLTDEKKRLITATLCGQAAPENEYHFFGEGCARKSIKKRLEDSAIQIVMYEKCGDKAFADRLADANLRAMAFMQELLPCTGENFEIDDIMQTQLVSVRKRASSVACTNELERQLEQRRPFFEQMIRLSHDASTKENIYRKLQVRIAPDGSVVER